MTITGRIFNPALPRGSQGQDIRLDVPLEDFVISAFREGVRAVSSDKTLLTNITAEYFGGKKAVEADTKDKQDFRGSHPESKNEQQQTEGIK